MGFLTGFGEGLSRSADLEHQANIAKQQDLTKANLELAKLLLGGTPEQQAQGLAIISDPSHPHRTDKDHPNLGAAKNLMQALGPGAASQSIASGQSPAGMAGMLSPDQSPLVQSGAGQMAGSPNIGDQGTGEPISAPSPVGAPPPGTLPNLPSPAPAPPLPPQPAAMTTNPPATEGGKISPAAAAPGAPPPTPPPSIAPAPPPPAPPSQMAQFLQTLRTQEAQPDEEIPSPGLNAAQQEIAYKARVARSSGHREIADRLDRADALLKAGAPPQLVWETALGKESAPLLTAQIRNEGQSDLAKFKAHAQQARDAEKYAQQSRETDVKFAHAQVLKRMGLANTASKEDLKVTWHEIPDPTDPNGMRTVKVPITNADAKAMAGRGETLQSKVPGLVLNRMVSAVAADKRLEEIEKDIPKLMEHIGPLAGQISSFEDLVGSEDPVVRKFLTDRAQVAAYMTSMHGARGIGLMREFENSAGRLKDNPEAFAAAISSLREGTQDFLDTSRPPAGSAGKVGAPPPTPTVPGAPKVGDSKTFKNGKHGVYKNGPQGLGWYVSE